MILLRVPGELRYRGLFVRTVAATCKLARDGGSAEGDQEEELDLSDRFDAEMVSATSEVFNNITLHAYASGGAGDVVLEAYVEPDYLVVRLKDFGRSLDRGSVDAPDLDALPEGGLGIFIVESFVDEFDYEPGQPNVWSLKKYLPTSSVRPPGGRRGRS